jgi:hypothetical protein
VKTKKKQKIAKQQNEMRRWRALASTDEQSVRREEGEEGEEGHICIDHSRQER